MNEVVVMTAEISRHECWESAIRRVVALSETERANLWLRSVSDGVFVFDTRPADKTDPMAWITDPVQYRRAASRGDLEDVPTFFHAGPELGTPTRLSTATKTT